MLQKIGREHNRPLMAEPTQWEYWIEVVTLFERWTAKRQAAELAQFVQRLNAAGQNYWEMVGFEAVPLTGQISGNINAYLYLVFFKRPVSRAQPSAPPP